MTAVYLTRLQKPTIPAMEGQYAQQPFHGQAPFFYYHPDPNSETRHHGQFTPHPHGHQYQQHMQPMQQQAPEPVPIYAPQPYHGHIQCPQPQYSMPPYAPQALLTPVQSPRSNIQKPAVMVQQDSPYMLSLDTDCYMPATPPLSASGSAVSSPPSTCEILPTPVNANFMQFYGSNTLEGVKGWM